MMASELQIRIPEELFAPAESSCFEGKWELPCLQSGPDEYVFSKPLPWQVRITNVDGALLVSGTVTAEGKGTCARCLESFDCVLVGEVEGYYLTKEASVEDPEFDLDEDEFAFLPENKTIDLEPLLKAALLLEMPLIPLCGEDCKGLCPHCGQDLNEAPCSCSASEPKENKDNPFAVLKDLKLDEN